MVKGLDFILLDVPDVDQAVAFYSTALGLVPDTESAQPGTFTQFQPTERGAVFAVINHPGITVPYRGLDLWWNVDAVDALHTRLVAQGVTVVEPPTDKPFGRSLIIQDPVGHKIYFYQPPA